MPHPVSESKTPGGASVSEESPNGADSRSEDLRLEFERIRATAVPLLQSVKRYATAEARLAAFKAKENTRLAFLRLGMTIAAGVFLAAAWAFMAAFLYQLVRELVPTLPWLAPLSVSVVHVAIALAAFAYSKKLRLE